jgi:hypothetical protein
MGRIEKGFVRKGRTGKVNWLVRCRVYLSADSPLNSISFVRGLIRFQLDISSFCSLY